MKAFSNFRFNNLAISYRITVLLFASIFNLYQTFGQLTKPYALIPKVKISPVIDGKIQAMEWQTSTKIDDYVNWTLNTYAIDKVETFLSYDNENIYVAFRGFFSDKKLFSNTLEEYKPIDSHLWGRNHFSVKLIQGNNTIELKAGPSLSKMDFKNGDLAWNGTWDFKAAINENNWTGEFKIPFTDFGLKKPLTGEIIQMVFSSCLPSGISADWAGNVRFLDIKPVKVENGKWPDPMPGKNKLAINFENNSNQKAILNINVTLFPFEGRPNFLNQQGQGNSNADMSILLKGLPLHFNKKVTLNINEKSTQSIDYELINEANYYGVSTVTDAKGDTLRQSTGYWFSIVNNREKLKSLSKKLIGTTGFTDKKNVGLMAKGKDLNTKLSALQNSINSYWASKKWNEFTIKVNELETQIVQFDQKSKVANLNRGNQNNTFSAIATHALQKIKRDKAFLGEFTQEIELSTAKNEYESFQIILLPFGTDIKNIKFKVSDLQQANGSKIDKESIELSLVDYNYIKYQPSYETDNLGWHPDALLPINKPLDIQSNEICRPIWVTIQIPKSAETGKYIGNIEIFDNENERKVINIKLNVANFELPTVTHLNTHTWNEIELMAKFYNMKELPLSYYQNFSELLLKNRLNPSFAGINYVNKKPNAEGKYDFSNVEKLLGILIPKGLSKFSMLQMKKGDYPADELKQEYQFIKAYADFLRSKGWLDKALIELWDEPTVLEWEGVKQRAEAIKKIAPDLKTQLFCSGAGPFKFWDDSVSKKYGLNDVIDIWMPTYPIEAPQVQKSGHEVWAYFATLPRSNAPNFFIDAPAIQQRCIPWYCFMYGLDGFEHWSTTYFTRNVKEGEPMENKWPNALWDSRTFHDFHGEGQMVYPGADGKFYSSIRLETFRDGMDDYEYLYKLKDLLKTTKLKTDDPVVQNAVKLLNISETLLIKYPSEIQETLENTLRYSNNPEKFLEYRNQLIMAIETLQN